MPECHSCWIPEGFSEVVDTEDLTEQYRKILPDTRFRKQSFSFRTSDVPPQAITVRSSPSACAHDIFRLLGAFGWSAFVNRLRESLKERGFCFGFKFSNDVWE